MAPLPADRALTRAAVVFMGATVLAGCGKSDGPRNVELSAPAYGAPPIQEVDAAAIAPAPEPVPAYGPAPVAPSNTSAPSSPNMPRKP
jgi:hypothetical protein